MDLGTLATIIILAILTVIIFTFAFVVFRQIHNTEKTLVVEGKRDGDIVKNRDQKKRKSYKVANIVTDIFSTLIAGVAVAFMVFSLYVKSTGGLLYTGGRSLMVVASNSMSAVYAPSQLESNGGYLPENYADLEFSRGDLLLLSEVPSQSEMQTVTLKDDGTYLKDRYGSLVNKYLYTTVFVYSNSSTKGENIIHRLYYIGQETDGSFFYVFRGDNNNYQDTLDGTDIRVSYSELKGMYVGNAATPKVGYFFLFFESMFGMYAVFSSVIMIVLSSVYTSMIEKEYDKRWNEIDHQRLVVYEQVHDIHVKVQAGWAGERYELRQKIGELKERAAENYEELKNKVEEHHEEVKAKVEQHREEVKAHIEEKKAEPVASVKPAVVEQPVPVEKPVPQPAPVVQPKPEEPKPTPKVEEPKPEPKVETPKPEPMPEEPKPMPKKVFGKHGVYVKIVKSEEDQEDQPAGVAIKK